MLKKPLAIILASLLAATSLIACGNKDDGDTSSKTGTSSASVDKNAKLKISVEANAAVQGYGSDTEDDNMFINALREKTGYKNLDINAISGDQVEAYNMMFSSGDVPDAIYTQDIRLYQRYSAQGALAPVDDLIDQYGSNISSRVTDAAWAAVTMDDKKYGIPVPAYQKYDDVDLGQGVVVRADWIKDLGLDYPTTTDEMYDFLKTIKEKNPGGNVTAPYVANGGDNGNPFHGLRAFTAPFALDGLMDMAVPFIVYDGELVDAQDIYLKDCLEYLNKLYSEGLIDNEYLFSTRANATEKLTSGQAAVAEGGYWDIATFDSAAKAGDEDAAFGFLPELKGPDGTSGQYQVNPVSLYYLFPKDAKYSKEAIDFINTYLGDEELQQFINFGEEGVHYTKEDGNFTPIKPAYDEIVYKIHFRMWNDPEIWLPNALLAGYEPALKDYVKDGEKCTRFNINTYRPQTDVELEKSRTLIDLRNEYCAKIITGALPVSAVDEYLAAADASGRQEVIKASQEWFESEGKAIYESLN